MGLSFVEYGSENIDSSLPLTECIAIGLNDVEEIDHQGRLWASQVAHCPRRGALEATITTTRPFLAHGKVYCEIGNTVESLVIQAWENRGKLLFSQYKLPEIREFPSLNTGGYVDAIALQGGKIRVVEIKTCGALPIKPREDYLAQAMFYSAFTGFPATLVFFSRDVADWSGKLKLVQFDLGDENAKHYMFNAVYARLCIDKKYLPDKSALITAKAHCGYCNFIDFCWNNKKEPHDLKSPALKSNIRIIEKALQITDEIMHPDNITSRRNGILKHLSHHGTKAARELLSGKTWPDS